MFCLATAAGGRTHDARTAQNLEAAVCVPVRSRMGGSVFFSLLKPELRPLQMERPIGASEGLAGLHPI